MQHDFTNRSHNLCHIYIHSHKIPSFGIINCYETSVQMLAVPDTANTEVNSAAP